MRLLVAMMVMAVAMVATLTFNILHASESPYPGWLQKFIDKSPTRNGINIKQIARATYDVAADGGTVAAHGLGVYLPPNSIITRSFYYVKTAFTDGGAGTVAVHCEDANNIVTAVDMTGKAADSLNEGGSTGATSAMVKSIANRCEITATVATAAQSTGKLIVWVEYVAHP